MKFLKEYLSFSKNDRIGLISLVILIMIIYLLPRFFAKDQPFPLKQDSALVKAIDTLESRQSSYNFKSQGQKGQYRSGSVNNYKNGELFQFDPNTLSTEGWQRLGLNEKNCKTINNYRDKGGRFYKAEDLQKIWGLPEGFYQRVKDYISDRKSTRLNSSH